MSDKDKAPPIERFTTVDYSEYVDNMRPMFDGEWVRYSDHVSALATVRREAREEAFKTLCPDCREGDEPTYSNQARWFYHKGEVGCAASKLRIAALERASQIGGE